MMFRPIVEIEVPSLPEDMTARLHNSFAKEALREAMLNHHKKYIKRKFEGGNRQRYGFMPRQPRYEATKLRRRGHNIDLVNRGWSKTNISKTVPIIRIGGAAEGGKKGLSGTYRLRFAWRGGAGRERQKKGGVTAAVMLLELARWADDEANEAADNFTKGYWRRVEEWRGSRKRIRMPRR